MNKKYTNTLFLSLIILMAACQQTKSTEVTATPTPTVIPGSAPDMPKNASLCEDLSGMLELQLLVGPSEAVGLEPVAIGEIQFLVASAETPYTFEGANTISYEDVLVEEWGTYTVSFNMDITLSGFCSGEKDAEQLMVDTTMSGDQLVKVESEGFHGEYPWSGTHENQLTFPLQEGATAGGEGWQLVLHINQ